MKSDAADALRAEVFGTVFLLGQYLARQGDEVLRPLDLTTKQWLLLALLAKGVAGERPTLSEAACWYGSSRQNVKQIARQLVARGYLKLVQDPRDRRALRLELTARVRRFDEPREAARLARGMRQMLGDLGPEELATLRGLLQRWLEAISPQATPERGALR